MIPLVDIHCHLLAGLDDGPRSEADALAMCRLAHGEGVRLACALAHQNERWHAVTRERIRVAARQLAERLGAAGVPLSVFPAAEVMVCPDLEAAWQAGRLCSIADRGQYLLLEMPHNLFVDLRTTVERLRKAGIRPILAHAERCPDLLHGGREIEELIRAGCLVQVSSGSVTDPPSRADARVLRDWFKRGIVHVLGSDGHSPSRRPPRMAGAYGEIRRWVGAACADRVCSTTGTAILHGLPLHVPDIEPRPSRWCLRLW